MRQKSVAQRQVGGARFVEEVLDVGTVEQCGRRARHVRQLELPATPDHHVPRGGELRHPGLEVLDPKSHRAREAPPEPVAAQLAREVVSEAIAQAEEPPKRRFVGLAGERVRPVGGVAWNGRGRHQLARREPREGRRGDGASVGRKGNSGEVRIGRTAGLRQNRLVNFTERGRAQAIQPALQLAGDPCGLLGRDLNQVLDLLHEAIAKRSYCLMCSLPQLRAAHRRRSGCRGPPARDLHPRGL